ncbi:hypothetical protein IA623_10395 [Listeria seeligeri]|uniref:DUF6044 family protein n=1 Tax=Listeria seeligeri TaxID=1640 RepID=UPI001624F092|nr:DUF6044 family protein [Listeria seeligeri]MBC1734189.1 hypothetical protein [Listeria seeligeri]MBF2366116.1 hypothetical protein [Listeria seeligeri]MBF2539727.1 hypothetical protein [Listeria seeligeri]MBF2586470.1 hypothetical protein [Listeria seeligeri]MBF2605818.1 hypothetical protein [Listeria seeligeri]
MWKKHKWLFVAILLLIIYVAPLFILGGDSHVRIHDNLDSNVTWYKMVLDSGDYTAKVGTANIDQIMDGSVPRDTFDSEFVGIDWLYILFSTPVAFAISQLITRVFAFLGLFLWARDYLIKDKKYLAPLYFVSLAFALTPYWPSGMLSTLGMPLALWAFLNIRNHKRRIWNVLILTLLPFYSSLILGFCFFLVMVGCIWLYDFCKKKQFNGRFLLSILYMGLIYLIVNYRFIYAMFLHPEPDSRSEFGSHHLSLLSSIKLSLKNFVIGHTHDQALASYIILPTLLLVLVLIIIRKEWAKEKLFLWMFGFTLFLSFWYGFWWFDGWNIIKDHVEIMRTFNFSRFHFLQPFLFYGLFALAIVYLLKKGNAWKKLAYIAITLQLVVVFVNNSEIYYRYGDGTPSINEFYATEQFEEIKDYIGKPQSSYRVGSIGLHPSVSQENGFYTVDGYVNSYPLAYKREFRKIIAGELDKSPVLEDYYDNWGNRCYLFSAELGKNYDFGKESKKHIKKLDFNSKAFQAVGGEYILSAVPIDNAAEQGLTFEKAFNDKQSYWKIYLYKVAS